MTKRQMINRAIEYILEQSNHCSCTAINKAQNGGEHGTSTNLENEYAMFYDQRMFRWPGLEYGDRGHKSQEHRIMLLLLFAEVGLEGLKP